MDASRRWPFAAWLAAALLIALPAAAQEDELSKPQAKFLRAVASDVEKMESYLAKDRWPQALKFHNAAVEKIAAVKDELLPPALMALLQPELDRLVAARVQLEAEQLQPAELPALKTGSGTIPDFARDIAPILNDRCGGCHVRNQRGQFSMATYMALMDSGQVEAGQPVNSRLVQVLENGEMPPDAANRVPEADIVRIREWIAAGAAFEGDANAGLAMLAGGNAANAAGPAMTEVARPKGNETVSFSRDIAPILAKNCRGCHVEAERPRGNLNLTTIEGLLRGGDRGGAVTTGDGAASLLVKKLRGTADGQRMPQAAPPLPDEQIRLIETWIAEGAAFDGGDPGTALGTLAALAEVSGMDHKELAARRQELAIANWQLVFPGEQPTIVEEADFQLVTGMAEPLRNRLLDRLGAVTAALRETLETPADQSLVGGKVTVFALGRQYDFGEFGRMVLGRESGSGQPATWKSDGVDAWVAILVNDELTDDQLEAVLAASLSAVHVSGLTAGVPRWFADGAGMTIAARSLDGNETVKGWPAVAAAAASQLSAPGKVRDPSTPETTAALGSFHLLRTLLTNRATMRKVLDGLADAPDFSAGFVAGIGAPPATVFPDELPRGNRTP